MMAKFLGAIHPILMSLLVSLSSVSSSAELEAERFTLDANVAQRFAEDWIASWNARDMDRILSHYTDDFSMTSPRIVQLGLAESGTLQGKAAVREYWSPALRPESKFQMKLLNVFLAVDSMTVLYEQLNPRNNRLVTEVFYFNSKGLVHKSTAYYALTEVN